MANGRAQRPRRAVLGAAAAGSLALGCGLAACTGGGQAPTPQQTASAFLTDWSHRDWAGMRALTASPPSDFTAVNQAAFADLGVTAASFTAGPTQSGSGNGSGNGTAHQNVTEHLTLGALGRVSIRTTISLVNSNGHWLVRWAPSTIAPALRAGDKLQVRTTWPARAQILGAGGVPLTTQARMVIVGLEGSRVKNPKSLTTALVAAGATRQEVALALAGARANPTYFEPVYTVTWARYQRLKPAIYPLPGTVFETEAERTAITPGLADGIVGAVGPITAQELGQLGAPYDASSVVGQTGLEGVAERQLAGTPAAAVVAVGPSGAAVATVASIPQRPGTPVATTIDPAVQRAAEAALASDTALGDRTAALVAVNATNGAVLAAADVNSGGFDVALEGAYPPGSTFKVITSAALIGHGLTPSSPASCPPTATVDGEVFRNAEGDAPVSDLLRAFAESCNTAFIGLATRNLTAADLPRTARMFGLGGTPRMGLAAYAGSVPTPSDEADLAATSIGQGQVLVSPLDMAMVAATVDAGAYRAPRLVSGAPDDQVPPAPLPAAVAADLRTMMAQVVASGTAAGQGLPAGTYAKTGTAQFGTGKTLKIDAWLIGFRGDIAFAVVVNDSPGNGGPADGPIAARFLKALSG
jgi:cell division protein FtsI/penicillin-binding protein 2